VFAALWTAQLGSNVGTWMQTVGAQWLLVGRADASALVALVQTATTLPFLFLALPSGVLADVFDRRRMLIAVNVAMAATAGVMTTLTAAGAMTPALVLGLTFLLGCGQALLLPAWQAVVPGVVERRDLPAASALNGLSQNAARVVGPAIAGVLIAGAGVEVVFALNAASFLGAVAVLALWRAGPRPDDPLGRERMLAALRAGTRYVRAAPRVRRILLRMALFIVPAAALWALLPVVANRDLGLGSSGYGLLFGALGLGAVIGALALARLRRRLSPNRLLVAASVVFALGLAATALVRSVPVIAALLVPAGMAWLTVLAGANAALQLTLPSWVRARGLSVYQLVLMGGQAIGAAAWGVLAQQTDDATALLAAAGTLVLGAASVVRWPMAHAGGLDRTPVSYWPAPELAFEPSPRTGPMVVTATWTVAAGDAEAFVAAMEAVERSRRRTGAIRWDLYRTGEDPGRFVEVYELASWEEHLRQHDGRLTGADREFEERAMALAAGPPEVAHLFPAH